MGYRRPIVLVRSWIRARLRTFRRPLLVSKHSYINTIPVPPLFYRITKYVFLTLICVVVITPIFFSSYTHPPAHYKELARRCTPTIRTDDGSLQPIPGCANPQNEKVFISAILFDKSGHLAGGLWGRQLVQLVRLLGPDNVYLSVYENDSGARGKAALESLKEKVGCRHSIVSEDHFDLTTQMPLNGNVTLPGGGPPRTKRIAYLAELRNRALRPLDRRVAPESELAEAQASGDDEDMERMATMPEFDKVLFLNDIIFKPLDAAQLLFSTNQQKQEGGNGGGSGGYLAACSLDWFHPFRIYDIYALRDDLGRANYHSTYPFFFARPYSRSRADILAQKDAVRVTSCWGGMMAVQARYLQNLSPDLPFPSFQEPGAHVIDPEDPPPSPFNTTSSELATMTSTPVRFRFEPGLYYDACECCLFSADLTQAAISAAVASSEEPTNDPEELDDSDTRGIFINPYVRVAYDPSILSWLPLAARYERLLLVWSGIESLFTWAVRIFTPTPPSNGFSSTIQQHGQQPQLRQYWEDDVKQNPYYNVKPGELFREEIWDNATRTAGGSWRLVNRRGRSGLFCGVREMQILTLRPPPSHSASSAPNSSPNSLSRTDVDEEFPSVESGRNWVNTRIPPGQSLNFKSYWGDMLPEDWWAEWWTAPHEVRERYFEDK